MNRKKIWFLPAIAVTIAIFLLSTFFAVPFQVEGVIYLDKIEHCLAYFVLTLSFLIAYKKAEILTKSKSIQLLIGASVYGFGLELVQFSFFSYRYFEWMDVLADVLGVLIGFSTFKLFNYG